MRVRKMQIKMPYWKVCRNVPLVVHAHNLWETKTVKYLFYDTCTHELFKSRMCKVSIKAFIL